MKRKGEATSVKEPPLFQWLPHQYMETNNPPVSSLLEQFACILQHEYKS